MRFIYDDGGHDTYAPHATGDCAIRAISVVTGKDYRDVKSDVLETAKYEKGRSKRSDGETYTRLATVRSVMSWYGWKFVDSRKKPLAFTEENWGDRTYMLWVPWHFTAVIDGAIHDTFDSSKQETEIVKGYWYKRE